jgi:hypothetical protein
MLGEKKGLSGDLTGRTSGRHNDRCDRMARSGGGGDLSSGESEFLHRRTLKEGEEWIW